VLDHDCEVVTGPPWLPRWLELESALLLEPSPLCVELEPSLLASPPLCIGPYASAPESLPLCAELVPSSLWLDVPVVGDGLVAAVLDAPPLPKAATASHAATNVASVAAVMRRRTRRVRCLTGASGDSGMWRMVAAFAQILLGTWYGAGKDRLADLYGASKVT
jgi:hypothetical protein